MGLFAIGLKLQCLSQKIAQKQAEQVTSKVACASYKHDLIIDFYLQSKIGMTQLGYLLVPLLSFHCTRN